MIKLSVICLTYNHAAFIRQALDGFVMQKTDFPFEVIVHDDASTDGTADIIREYAARYPDIVRPVYQTENQWSSGVPFLQKYVYPLVRGQYVALCEGDDYWTDENKLQKQVDCLDAHPDCSLCFHPVTVKWEEGEQPDSVFPDKKLLANVGTMNLKSLLKQNFIQTNSVVYRWRFHQDSLELIPNGILPGDWFLHLLHAEVGKIVMLPDVMAVYRKHKSGIWWEACSNDSFYLRNGLPNIAFFHAVESHFGSSRRSAVKKIARRTFCAALAARRFDVLQKLAGQYPDEYRDIFNIVQTCLIRSRKRKQRLIFVLLLGILAVVLGGLIKYAGV